MFTILSQLKILSSPCKYYRSHIHLFSCFSELNLVKYGKGLRNFYGEEELTNILKRKMNYCETRTYNKKNKRLDKPRNKEFK